MVKINFKEMSLKHIIAKTFLRGYFAGAVIMHSNGNYKDCSADNLIVVTKGEFVRQTGCSSRGQHVSVTFPNGEKSNFSSVREAAKELHCSYQTVLDYMNGSYSTSCLDGMLIQRI